LVGGLKLDRGARTANLRMFNCDKHKEYDFDGKILNPNKKKMKLNTFYFTNWLFYRDPFNRPINGSRKKIIYFRLFLNLKFFFSQFN